VTRGLVCALAFAASAVADNPIVLDNGAWQVRVTPSTLAVEAVNRTGRHVVLSRAALTSAPAPAPRRKGKKPAAERSATAAVSALQAGKTEAHWSLRGGDLRVSASLSDEGFRISFQTTEPGTISWPVLAEETGLEAVVLPRGEGLYIPIREPRWRTFLQEQGPFDTMESLSMPMWGLRYPGLTVAYIAENPFDNQLAWTLRGAALGSRLTHRFQYNHPETPHTVLVRFGGTSPVESALLFREWFGRHFPVTTYREKIAYLPDAGKLLGAAHIYLWARSLLAFGDVTDWPGLIRALAADPQLQARFDNDARQAVHDASTATPVTLIQKRAILAALTPIVENPAITPFLVPRDRRGAGVSPKMIRRLHDAGLDRLWLGIDSGEIALTRAEPETVKLARESGYLFAPYDSYHSIHSPTEKDTWETAQFGKELFDKGAVVNHDGSRSVGFNGKGAHLSSNAAFPYLVRRVDGILKDVPFNSWFVDCDATGELFDNYSPAYPQSKAQDMRARVDRLQWLVSQKHLVVGSEGGAWYAAPVIHFAHGMMSPLFGWRDPLLHDPESKYFVGRYYPPEGPALFLKPVELPEKYRALYYDPRYRLPLYQAAFHDMLITTNHWSQGSLKYTNVAPVRELLELLYGVPPLYHLNADQAAALLPAIQTHYRVFSPLHREIGGVAMSSFDWLTTDHLLQRAVYGKKVEVICNFGNTAASYQGHSIPPASLLITGMGEPRIYTPR
jgi:hypothetical protein